MGGKVINLKRIIALKLVFKANEKLVPPAATVYPAASPGSTSTDRTAPRLDMQQAQFKCGMPTLRASSGLLVFFILEQNNTTNVMKLKARNLVQQCGHKKLLIRYCSRSYWRSERKEEHLEQQPSHR